MIDRIKNWLNESSADSTRFEDIKTFTVWGLFMTAAFLGLMLLIGLVLFSIYEIVR